MLIGVCTVIGFIMVGCWLSEKRDVFHIIMFYFVCVYACVHVCMSKHFLAGLLIRISKIFLRSYIM